jgi:4-hydroxy-3-methylbut-2-enyl diphosphate reductase
MVYRLLDEGKKVCTLGPIIHNPQIVAEMAGRGARIIEEPSQAEAGEIIVLRSHGVTKQVIEYIKANNMNYADASCPFVSRVQKIVAEQSRQPGAEVIILGDAEHPEVKAIVSYCEGSCHVADNEDDFRQILEKTARNGGKIPVLAAQTTFNKEIYKSCVNLAKKICTNTIFFDTICNATALRQKEAVQLAENCDIMIVVGGKTSSNTAKLRDVCQRHCPAFLIESAGDLKNIDIMSNARVGLTAGASTPARIIKEVQETMSDFMNVNTVDGDDISFEEGLEQTLKSVHNGDRVIGEVIAVGPTEVQVDIGTKHAGYVPLAELTDDPTKTPADLAKVGDRLDLIVSRVNDVEGTVTLSKKRLDSIAGYEKICKAAETSEILSGIVTEIVRGGVIAVSNGVKVFIPMSQATLTKNEPLEGLLRKEVQFRIIEVNPSRRRSVGSIRSVLKDQKKQKQEKFWEEAEIGKVYKGEVKSLTSYGAFVDLGGVDGMVHISELSWGRIHHPSEVIKEGDVVEVYIRDIDAQSKKISLGYRKNEDNPWEILRQTLQSGVKTKGKIVSLTDFGAFANISPGIDGLIHISQISQQHVAKPQDALSVGQEVEVMITDIDYERKRVSLSIRAALNDEDRSKAPEERDAAEEKGFTSYEIGPDGVVGELPKDLA